MRTQVSAVASSSSPDAESLEEEKDREVSSVKGLEKLKESARKEMERLDARIAQINDDAGVLRWLPDSFGGVADSEELRAAKERQQKLEQEIERLEDAIRESDEARECIETRLAGGSCDSLWNRIANAGTAGISQLKETFGKLNDMATNITMLLVAIAVKNILFPIVFLMGAVKCGLPIARHASRLLCGFEEDARKLKETIASRTEPPGRQLEQSES